HNGNPPAEPNHLSFAILLNLASVVNADDKAVLWGFIKRYAPEATPENAPFLDKLTEYAVTYYQDFVKPEKAYRAPTDQERAAFEDLLKALGELTQEMETEEIQTAIFAIGKTHGFEPLRDWFKALYQVLLGQDQGPRFGSFVKLYGIEETKELIQQALDGALVGEPAA
ncbi:MAG: lysine--tRNA ligase, partial [Pseudomonadota bacterium]